MPERYQTTTPAACTERARKWRYDALVYDPWEDGDQHIDVEAIRARLRQLSDTELIREGRPARQLATPYYGRTPRKVFVVGLEECIAEWHRRHPRVTEGQLF